MSEEMMKTLRACGKSAGILHDKLTCAEELKTRNIQVRPLEKEHFCFRVLFPENSPIDMVSVSVPPGVNFYNPGVARSFETALFKGDGKEGKIVFNSLIGYYDCLRFESVEEILNELLRLAEYTVSNFPKHSRKRGGRSSYSKKLRNRRKMEKKREKRTNCFTSC